MNLAPIRCAICCPCSKVTSRDSTAIASESDLVPTRIVGHPRVLRSRIGAHASRICSKERAFVTSYTSSIPSILLLYISTTPKNRRRPEVSHSWIRTSIGDFCVSTSTRTDVTKKSTPMVGGQLASKWSWTQRCRIDVFPALDSPYMMIFFTPPAITAPLRVHPPPPFGRPPPPWAGLLSQVRVPGPVGGHTLVGSDAFRSVRMRLRRWLFQRADRLFQNLPSAADPSWRTRCGCDDHSKRCRDRLTHLRFRFWIRAGRSL
mmetsp:Transcript_24071/g.71814  ORF Transcript_24071/g.71814 Transcript_24071/m.71814 type:complete len:261 (-) Transcript_24071:12-794(-)